MKMIRIFNALDETEASYILELLKREGIYAYTKDPGSGEYMRITQGYSVYGKIIYVDEKNREEAERLILEWLERQDILPKDEIPYKIPWYRNRRIVARGILVGTCITWIVLLILESLN